MRLAVRRLLLFVLLCVGVGCSLAGVSQAVSEYGGVASLGAVPAEGGLGEPAGELLGRALVIPGSPSEAQQREAQREAWLSDPRMVAERNASRTKFAHLDTQSAATVAREAFPSLIDHAEGSPQLPPGAHIANYPTDGTARVELANGRHGVIESIAPIAVETSPGHRTGIDLSVGEVAGAFQAARSDVRVRVPKHLASGVALASTGVSLTPAAANGSPLSGADGMVDGASVLYANTQPSTDAVVKPTSEGFDETTLLRSRESPERLYFRVEVPTGAHLTGGGAGPVEIRKSGSLIASILPPAAEDAAGTIVPVSMQISAGMVEVDVDVRQAEYQYPIAVDPSVVDNQLLVLEKYYGSHWKAETSNGHEDPFDLFEDGNHIEISGPVGGGFTRGEWGGFDYEAPGASAIYGISNFHWAGHGEGGGAEEQLQIRNKTHTGKYESVLDSWPEKVPVEPWEVTNLELCAEGDKPCKPIPVSSETEGNYVSFAQFATQTTSASANSDIYSADVDLVQTQNSVPFFNTTKPELEGHPNPLYGAEHWVNSASTLVRGEATDPGIGIAEVRYSSTTDKSWSSNESFLYPSHDKFCEGVICDKEVWTEDRLEGLPEGRDNVTLTARNATYSNTEGPSVSTTVYVDNAPPHGIAISGLESGNSLGENPATLKAEAVSADAGMKSLAIAVDGRTVGAANGACSPGPCTAKGEWAIDGLEFGGGAHKLTVTATDNAGNTETATFTLNVRHATPVAVGPGMVDPQSGEFSMSANDASIAAPGANLTFARSYGSRHLTAGAQGPLGPQWSLALGAQESITKLPDGNATLTAASGAQTTFTNVGNGRLTSPNGDSNLALWEYDNEKGELKEYELKNAAQRVTTHFTSTGGPTAELWHPTKQEGPLPTQTVQYIYKPVEGVSEPKYELAPEPVGVTGCLTRLEKEEEVLAGCRALEFKYATSKTATGEGEKEWGEYVGRLKEVVLLAYTPKGLVKTSVADYSYDKQGRLRAEWNPQLEHEPKHELKTSYGYDAEGHVTVVSAPGQQPWLVHYGTTPGDSNTGRLLSVTRPAAVTEAEVKTEDEKVLPVNTKEPTLSSTKPVVGTKISVSSEGTWSNSPLSYSYAWEDCTGGAECTVIPGAVNQSYYPVKSDELHTLRALVRAVNADGTVSAETASTSAVATGTPNSPAPEPPAVGKSSVWTVEYQVPLSGTELPNMGQTEVEKWGQQADRPVEGAAIFPPDSPEGWPAKTYKRATLEYLDGDGRTVNTATPTGAVATTEYNRDNDVIRTLTPDNRAAALKSTCESKTSCKSAEVAKLLSTESAYEESGSEPGTELLSTLGPQHTVELPGGSHVEARSQTLYSYDEGAPPEGGPYDLVTQTLQGADVAGKLEDTRETRMSYSGQNNVGWKLRKPTAVVTEPGGLDLIHKTLYNTSTGSVIETKTPASSAEVVYPPVSKTPWGTAGSGEREFDHPEGAAYTITDKVVIADTGNDRLEEFKDDGSSGGGFAVGSAGSGDLEFSEPQDVAVDPANGNLYVSDTGNNRVEVLTVGGKFIESIGWGVENGEAKLESCLTACKAGIAGSGNGQFNKPVGVTLDAAGDLWVTDMGNDRVEEISPTNTYMTQFGSKGSGNGQLIEPTGIAISEGNLYVADFGNDRIQEFSTTGSYRAQFGSKGTGAGQFNDPVSIAANTISGDLFVSDTGNSRMQEWTPAGKYLTEFGSYGSGTGQLNYPTGVAVSPTGKIYVADQLNNRVAWWAEPGEGGAHMAYSTTIGSDGSGNGQFNYPGADAIDGHGNLWVTDYENNRVEEFTSAGKFIAAYGSHGSGHVQFEGPTGIAVNQSTGDVYVGDCENHRIEELNSSGEYVTAFGTAGSEPGEMGCPGGVKVDASGHVWIADSEHDRIEEYSATGTFMAAYGKAGSGEGEFNDPTDLAFSATGDIYVVDSGNDRIEELSPTGEFFNEFGAKGTGSGKFLEPVDISVDATGNIYVVDKSLDRVQEFSPKEVFLATFASSGSGEGELNGPRGIAINAAGSMYVVDSSNNRVEEWTSTEEAVHNTKTTYYTAKEEAEVLTCRNHPEWAGLPCQTGPAAQPETGDELAVTTINAYNIWEEPETTTEAVGAITRTKTETYDPAGRLTTSATSATEGTSLPTVTDAYNETTGALEKQATPGKTITSTYNTLGQLASYTDAAEATTSYEYDVDGRLKKTSDGKGTEAFTYSETGFPTELVSEYGTSKLAFSATYDTEGNMLTEKYPNGMTATYAYDQTGKPTSLEYEKTTHCTEKCVWFSDKVVPSIQGQWLEQTSSLSHQAYTYDAAGRLTQVQNTPTGKGCTTHIYTYDEETNRTSLTTREPNSKNECASEGGTIEKHTYDEANRLTDPGTTYNTFGDITSLPATDAGGKETSETLTSTYYTDNQLDTQTQNGQTIGYNLDPDGRTLETVATGKKTSDVTEHYTGPGSEPTWTVNPASEWTRNIHGLNGQLAAVQNNGETPVLQLASLHGDIIATAYLSETATALASTADTSEYGVPTTSLPPKYAWLGANEIPTELPSGALNLGARSYVPQLGRFLQPDPIPGGSANAYTFGDPVNSSDLTGEFTWGFSSYVVAALDATGEEIIAREAAREAAARAAAEAAAREAEAAADAAGPQYSEGEEWEEWEEESEYEYASDKQGAGNSAYEPTIEPAVLYQALPEAASGEAAEGAEGVMRDTSAGVGGGAHAYGKQRYKVRLRSKKGSWTKTLDTYCGIVGGAFLTPGVDIFGAPAEVSCAGYGVYRAVEAIIENL
jgi:tripartite motif-containing protein 71